MSNFIKKLVNEFETDPYVYIPITWILVLTTITLIIHSL